MRLVNVSLFALVASMSVSGAVAQDVSLRGFRLEGNAGYDWFKARGDQNGKFGFGGAAGFDGQISNKIVIGPEFNYWQPNHQDNAIVGLNSSNEISRRQSRYQYGAAVRVGYLVSPDLLVFGKGGFVRDAQETRIFSPELAQVARYRFRTDGYQYGGGVEYTLHDKFAFAPTGLYVSAQYVRDRYDDHSSDQHAMGGVGIRFR